MKHWKTLYFAFATVFGKLYLSFVNTQITQKFAGQLKYLYIKLYCILLQYLFPYFFHKLIVQFDVYHVTFLQIQYLHEYLHTVCTDSYLTKFVCIVKMQDAEMYHFLYDTAGWEYILSLTLNGWFCVLRYVSVQHYQLLHETLNFIRFSRHARPQKRSGNIVSLCVFCDNITWDENSRYNRELENDLNPTTMALLLSVWDYFCSLSS